MHPRHIIHIVFLFSSPTVFAKPLTIQIITISSSTVTKVPCLCMTQQRGYFCGSRSVPGSFDPNRPTFTGDCDENTRYTCVARETYPFAPREAVDCGDKECVMVGGPDEAFGFDDCGA
ncbi:hypothetical protein DL98DRAFT_593631 [Cadophora sp. DSE1049]|nr:hypothetical protein DL98DRAFT_593631 [Cadophora sp. DSE1049]